MALNETAGKARSVHHVPDMRMAERKPADGGVMVDGCFHLFLLPVAGKQFPICSIVHRYRRRYRSPKWQENKGEGREVADLLQRQQLDKNTYS